MVDDGASNGSTVPSHAGESLDGALHLPGFDVVLSQTTPICNESSIEGFIFDELPSELDGLDGFSAGPSFAGTLFEWPAPSLLDELPNDRLNDPNGSDGPDGGTGTATVVSIDSEEPVELPKSSRLRVELPESGLFVPRSHFEPFEPGCPILSEQSALARLEGVALKPAASSDFHEYQLDDFAVYRSAPSEPAETTSLQQLNTKQGHTTFFFDGILSYNGTRIFVRKVPIVALPIGNYGSASKSTTRDQIWITSPMAQARNIYYRLNEPAREYARFFHPFLWVADLAKHFVDFLAIMGRSERNATIHHFRNTFATWLRKTHGNAKPLERWMAQHPSSDFRTSIAAHIPFLHKEAVGVLGHKAAMQHAIWSEIWQLERYKPMPKAVADPYDTIVTQYIFDTFKHLPFGDRLRPVTLDHRVKVLRDGIIESWRFHKAFDGSDGLQFLRPLETSDSLEQQIVRIKPGDTISTHRDTSASGTAWLREVPAGFDDVDRWFGLVLKVHTGAKGKRTFDVTWYYRPVDTLCGLMKYPWHNELFLSDHCSCRDRPKISADEVLGVHDVEFGGSPSTKAEFFCRQVYLSGDRSWVTLDETYLSCRHTRPPPSTAYHAGDTVLVHIDASTAIAEPCEVVCSFKEEGKRFIRLRRLLRRQESDPTARPNELVYTDRLLESPKSRIIGTCSVRFFKTNEEIPAPYSHNGAGGFFYIRYQEVMTGDGAEEYVPFQDFPTVLRQGFDPSPGALEVPRLRGLDLFCGGGNFGRGLEDGGGVEMRWANDYNANAIHTYMANAQNPELVSPFLGSIDDMQYMAAKGRFSKNVPSIGDVDFISAGSPCPGFSRVTNDKTTLQQRKNQSLVAAFASFVDLYRPKYALLENVPGIVQPRMNRDQDVFSQLICATVGLGYQTRFFFLDASSCGAPQRRSRVFLVVAAPGLRLPDKPQQTHSQPHFTRTMGLGKLSTGEAMVKREMPLATPFKFVSAQEATADLPSLYDAKPGICVPFPDHRVSIGRSRPLQTRISLIPTQPYGMNFAQAWFGPGRKQAASGSLTPSERELFPPEGVLSMSRNSGAFGRQHPHRLIETVTTTKHPNDAKCGRVMHWHEPRVLTIMESRRAQGFRDDEVLVGLPAQQLKIVGNSVAREAAVALGNVIRVAWAESCRGVGLKDDEYVVAAEEDATQTMMPLPDVGNEDEVTDAVTDDVSSAAENTWPISYQATPDTAATEISPSPQQGEVQRAGSKRPGKSTICVEIRASKRWKVDHDFPASRPTLLDKETGDEIVKQEPV